MIKTDVYVLNNYRYWQVRLIAAIVVTVILSLFKHFGDWPREAGDWHWAEWVLHLITAALVIKVLFFRINIEEVRSLCHSTNGLNQILNLLQKEENDVQSRIIRPLIEKMAKDPDGYGTLLINISNPWVLQLIGNFCTLEIGYRQQKIEECSERIMNNPSFDSDSHEQELDNLDEEIKQFKNIKAYCDKSTP